MRGTDRVPLYVVLWRGAGPSLRHDTLLRALRLRYPVLVRQEAPEGITLLLRPSLPALPLQSNQSGSLLVLGQIFARQWHRAAASSPADMSGIAGDLDEIAKNLIDDHWGSYLAFLRDPATGMLSVLRDPSGAIPATIIGDAALSVVADQIPRWLHEAVAGRPVIDWDAVAAQLHEPSIASHRPFLTAVRPVAAGSLAAIGTAEMPRQLWEPATIAAQALPGEDHLDRHLRDTVMDSVAALTAGHEKLLLELSGGLDSAILLGCLATLGNAPACITMATIQTSGDERIYARAAADLHGAVLTEAVLTASEMDYHQLADQADVSEPRLYGTDTTHERLTMALAKALGASAIVTGQGGDAVFFQEPTALVAADHLQARGFCRASWPVILDTAARSRGSIWSVLAAARGAQRCHQLPALVEHDTMLLGPVAREAHPVPSHPWIAKIDGVPPAKRGQLKLLATCQFFRGPTARADRFALIHPLLAQPVMELCLAIPAWRLAYGRFDRGLARDAFAAELPERISRRRGKGEVSTYYSHAIVANLGFLRDLLLEGSLAQRGLLDSDRLNDALSERSLVRRADHRVIIAYASLEAWLRSWS